MQKARNVNVLKYKKLSMIATTIIQKGTATDTFDNYNDNELYFHN